MKISITIFPILILLLITTCKKEELHVRAKQLSKEEDHSNMVMIDEEKRVLARITIDTVKSKFITAQTTFVGKVSANENKTTIISARVNGRIDRLYIRQEGQKITAGEAIYSIYSEELLTDQHEYLSAMQHREKFTAQPAMIDQLITGARKKLQLWGMTEQQIKDLETNGHPSALLTYYSGHSGFVTRLLVNEGEYIEIGSPLFQLSNFRTVWVDAEVYASEIRYLNENTEASIKIDGLSQKTFKGKVVFENPSLQENSKINLVRFQIDNENESVKPGMMARVTIDYDQKETLVIPKEALLIGRMKMVWIEVEPGMFESRTVRTGIENKSFVEILSGIREGECVVTTGAYLLNSESILKSGEVKAHSH